MGRLFRSSIIGLVLAAAAEVFIRLSLAIGWPPIIEFFVAPGHFLRLLFSVCGGSPQAALDYAREWMIYQFWIDTLWYGTIAWLCFWWRERRAFKFA